MLPEEALGSAADWNDPHGVRPEGDNVCPKCLKTEYLAGKRRGCAECRGKSTANNNPTPIEPGAVDRIMTNAQTRREERKATMPGALPRWTPEEDSVVRDNARKGAVAISEMLDGRTPKAIEQRAKRINVALGGTKTAGIGSASSGPKRTCECGRRETTPGPFAIHQRACPVHKVALEGRLIPEDLPEPIADTTAEENVDLVSRIEPHVQQPPGTENTITGERDDVVEGESPCGGEHPCRDRLNEQEITATEGTAADSELKGSVTVHIAAEVNQRLISMMTKSLIAEADHADLMRAQRDLLIERVDELEQRLAHRPLFPDKTLRRKGDTNARRAEIRTWAEKRVTLHRKSASFRSQVLAAANRLGGKVKFTSHDRFSVSFEEGDA